MGLGMCICCLEARSAGSAEVKICGAIRVAAGMKERHYESSEPAYSLCFEDHSVPERSRSSFNSCGDGFYVLRLQHPKVEPVHRRDASPPDQPSPVVFWLLPAFGVRGAGYFLGTTETICGSLIFLGYWSPRLGILGALGPMVTFIGTTSVIPFLPDGWVR